MGYQKNRPSGSGNRPVPAGWSVANESSEVNWDGVDAELLKEAISDATSHGDALLFGRTPDGGVMHLLWFYDGRKLDQYPKSVEEAEDLLGVVTMTYNTPQNGQMGNGTREDVEAPPPPSKPPLKTRTKSASNPR